MVRSLFALFVCFCLPFFFCWAETVDEATLSSEGAVAAALEEVEEAADLTTPALLESEGQPKRALQWDFVADIIDASVSPLVPSDSYYEYESNSGVSTRQYPSNNLSGNSLSSNNLRHPQCFRRGAHCHSDFECCDAMRCQNQECTSGRECRGPHSHCHSSSQCCGSLRCDTRINECMKPCKRTGSRCERSSQCCAAATCGRDGRCQRCKQNGGHCHSSSECCGDSRCRNHQCERHRHYL
eukprot:GHVS01080482.1.p1 GENE.GHVS01080482.1~~GHVS01080482.1.p1  ORF type:complete len:240 (+),score=18.52 GHVS01080482.1:201-920(+)